MKRTRLRVLSYNIHKGFSSGNRDFVLHKIREAIRRVHADLVLLQEVIGEHRGHARKRSDWDPRPQFEFLADEIWPHYAYGKNAIYTQGHHGNALLSKFPIADWENINISTNRLERRGLLHAVIKIPHHRKPLHAICTHLGLVETERRSQVTRLCSRIDAMVPHGHPLIIGGDFNDWRGRVSTPLQKRVGLTETFEFLQGAHARTFPSWLPALRLDRIYFRNLEACQARVLTGTPWSQLSDHAALLAEFEI